MSINGWRVSQSNFNSYIIVDTLIFFYTLEHKNHIKKFLRYINLRHRNIHFTCEEESNAKISFLEISITRSNNKLVTSLYRKKTFSGVYLNITAFYQQITRKA